MASDEGSEACKGLVPRFRAEGRVLTLSPASLPRLSGLGTQGAARGSPLQATPLGLRPLSHSGGGGGGEARNAGIELTGPYAILAGCGSPALPGPRVVRVLRGLPSHPGCSQPGGRLNSHPSPGGLPPPHSAPCTPSRLVPVAQRPPGGQQVKGSECPGVLGLRGSHISGLVTVTSSNTGPCGQAFFPFLKKSLTSRFLCELFEFLLFFFLSEKNFGLTR